MNHVGHAVGLEMKLLVAISLLVYHSSWCELRKQLWGQKRIIASMKCQNRQMVHIRKSTRSKPRQQIIYNAWGLSH